MSEQLKSSLSYKAAFRKISKFCHPDLNKSNERLAKDVQQLVNDLKENQSETNHLRLLEICNLELSSEVHEERQQILLKIYKLLSGNEYEPTFSLQELKQQLNSDLDAIATFTLELKTLPFESSFVYKFLDLANICKNLRNFSDDLNFSTLKLLTPQIQELAFESVIKITLIRSTNSSQEIENLEFLAASLRKLMETLGREHRLVSIYGKLQNLQFAINSELARLTLSSNNSQQNRSEPFNVEKDLASQQSEEPWHYCVFKIYHEDYDGFVYQKVPRGTRIERNRQTGEIFYLLGGETVYPIDISSREATKYSIGKTFRINSKNFYSSKPRGEESENQNERENFESAQESKAGQNYDSKGTLWADNVRIVQAHDNMHLRELVGDDIILDGKGKVNVDYIKCDNLWVYRGVNLTVGVIEDSNIYVEEVLTADNIFKSRVTLHDKTLLRVNNFVNSIVKKRWVKGASCRIEIRNFKGSKLYNTANQELPYRFGFHN